MSSSSETHQYILPSIQELATLSSIDRTILLNNLFEPHPSIHDYLDSLLFNKYTTYEDFIENCRIKFLQLDPNSNQTKEIISSHPRLGLPKTANVKLSIHSQAEQANLQKDTTDSELKNFVKLNADYEKTYPGLRFVLFVNGRGKDEIKILFQKRIQRNDYLLEVKDALNAMCDIALDRVKKLKAAAAADNHKL